MAGFAVAIAGCTSDRESKAQNLYRENVLAATKGQPTEFYGRYGLLDETREYLLDPVEEKRRPLIEKLATAYDQIALGRKRGAASGEVIRIPHLAAAPAVDGQVTAAEWAKAFHADGEYLLDTTELRNTGRISWYLGWHGSKLYAAVRVKDDAVFALPGTTADRGFSGWNRIYLGDCIEIFLRPTLETEHYYEFLVNPDGAAWTLDHVMQDIGFWRTINRHRPSAAAGNACRTADGYTVEWEIPLLEFVERYLPGNLPQAGDRFTFTMLHIDAATAPDRAAKRYSIRPLLYEGHNIFDYTTAELAE